LLITENFPARDKSITQKVKNLFVVPLRQCSHGLAPIRCRISPHGDAQQCLLVVVQ
jgi:hypothetical protein